MIIRLANGAETIVDDDWGRILSRWKWAISNSGYAMRIMRGRSVYIHRVVMMAPTGLEVDHINGNKLDNRSCNLRLA